MLSDAQYLDSSPSTDGEEIKKLLNSTLEREKLDGMKHLIALISLGHDASEFFPQVVKNVVAGSVELKRLVYMYLVHYAEVRSVSRGNRVLENCLVSVRHARHAPQSGCAFSVSPAWDG